MDERVLAAAPVDLRLAQRLSAELGVSRITGEILARRGFADAAAARAFLHPDFKLHSPYLLPGVAEAAARIDRALKRGETIAVHGDYDADGVTATFLLTEVLRSLGGEVVWHLPNRFSEGYGLSARAVEVLAEQGARLLVTVDCGVTAVAEVARARELGLDVVVTDHHEPKEELARLRRGRSASGRLSVSAPGRRRRRPQARPRAPAAARTPTASSFPSRCAPTSTWWPWVPWPTSCRSSTRTAPSS